MLAKRQVALISVGEVEEEIMVEDESVVETAEVEADTWQDVHSLTWFPYEI